MGNRTAFFEIPLSQKEAVAIKAMDLLWEHGFVADQYVFSKDEKYVLLTVHGEIPGDKRLDVIQTQLTELVGPTKLTLTLDEDMSEIIQYLKKYNFSMPHLLVTKAKETGYVLQHPSGMDNCISDIEKALDEYRLNSLSGNN